MRLRSRRVGVFGATAVAASCGLMLATWAGPKAGAATGIPKGQPVQIGASLSLSGDFSADGQAFQRGYDLWAAYQNAHGGLLGHQVKMVVVSDASSPTQVVTNYQKLISVNKVNLTFGPYSTLLSIPAAKIANRYGYAMVEGAGGGPSVFAAGLKNVFDVTLPVSDDLSPFAKWLVALPTSKRPKTVAYVTSNDPFTQPQIPIAQKITTAAGIKTVYSSVFPAEATDYTPIADAVAASKAQVVVLGAVDVPTVSAFMQAFEQAHYNPQVFISTAGPDQGATFTQAVGQANANGMMVPNSWYPGYNNASSQAMVAAYVAKYGGSPSDVNADVAEAYSVGQVVAQAVKATGGFDNSKILSYLHSGATMQSVQGPVKFNSLGENLKGVAFTFQWQAANFVQIAPAGDSSTVAAVFPKPVWGT
jgi:branched-chain amino acid transport system substrate-binding protein